MESKQRRKRRSFTPEFRAEAVRLVREGTKSLLFDHVYARRTPAMEQDMAELERVYAEQRTKQGHP